MNDVIKRALALNNADNRSIGDKTTLSLEAVSDGCLLSIGADATKGGRLRLLLSPEQCSSGGTAYFNPLDLAGGDTLASSLAALKDENFTGGVVLEKATIATSGGTYKSDRKWRIGVGAKVMLEMETIADGNDLTISIDVESAD